jgi:hypothetical protein
MLPNNSLDVKKTPSIKSINTKKTGFVAMCQQDRLSQVETVLYQ